jgi:subtilisin family serine protease
MARGSGTLCASPGDTAQYWNVSGTSLSCPLAAGAAALVWQVNPTFTNMQVLDALRSTASIHSNPNNEYGWGIIDAYAAASPVTGHHPLAATLPEKFILYGNYPNPFNPVTTISYEIPRAAEIQISVYNSLGEKVQLIFSGISPAGKHQLIWDAGQLGSGMYFLMLTSGEVCLIHKALLLK